MKALLRLTFTLGALLLAAPCFAANDLSISSLSLKYSNYLEGNSNQIRATVSNLGSTDLTGVVRFTGPGGSLGSDVPFSVLSGSSNTVFLNWTPWTYGSITLRAEVFPWSGNDSNPGNNAQSITINVLQDTDHDGIPNSEDDDQDGDGVLNSEDDFPLDASKTRDSDGDGKDNQEDDDDDNDGTLDIDDDFPEDPRYQKDSDGDKAPDQIDAFPFDPTEWRDLDGDGVGDWEDKDMDGDGIPDKEDPNPENHDPILNLSKTPRWVDLNEEFTLDASKSEDPFGRIIETRWTINDQILQGAVIHSQFNKAGLYPITVDVRDELGGISTKTFQIRALNKELWLSVFIGLGTILVLGLALALKRLARRP